MEKIKQIIQNSIDVKSAIMQDDVLVEKILTVECCGCTASCGRIFGQVLL